MRRLYLQVYFAILGILARLRRAGGQRLASRAPASRRTRPRWTGRRRCSRTGCPRTRTRREQRRRCRRSPRPSASTSRCGARTASPSPRWESGCRFRARARRADGCRRAAGRWASCAFPTAAGWWRASGSGASATRACSSSWPCSPSPSPSGPIPVARRLTRRLERLRAGVETLGAGDLGARVQVEGRDEVADLATSFNRAAARIEAVVGAQRTLLASASHELRSPLARIRVALELMGEGRPDLRDRVARDIAELDELIGELLLASRLQAMEQLEPREDVDLLGLVAEEAARTPAEVSGSGGDGARRRAAAAAARAQPARERGAARRPAGGGERGGRRAGACGCACAIAAPVCPRTSASGSSRRSTGPPRARSRTAAPGSACPWCARSRAATAARRAVSPATEAGAASRSTWRSDDASRIGVGRPTVMRRCLAAGASERDRS